MTKRILSLVLSLVLVLGLVTPVVNATDDSAISFDNVTYENVTIDGNVVNSNGSVQTPTELGGTSSTQPVVTKAPDCDCGNAGKDIMVHADNCMLKKYYQGISKQPSLTIWGMWSDMPTDAREYVLAYLSWTDNAKLVELEKRLSTGAFAEDSITVDGTEITAVNVPEFGSLNVTTPSASAQTAVQNYVASLGDSSAEQLFQWDISIKTASGQEWQPDGTAVKLELEVPGVKLHKYATVYVVHVDDEGNATQIPAQVTTDGKIAFETTGFSTFAAYTVDFEYEGVKYSIPGESSIYLSELFEQLRIPHDVEEVTNAVFSDTSLVTVTKDGSDWLLTSLKAFNTDETLTVSLSDGSSFVIKVTDMQYAVMYLNASDPTTGWSQGLRVSGYDGYMTVKLGTDGSVETDENISDGYSDTEVYLDNYPLVLVGPGSFTIGLQNIGIYEKSTKDYSLNNLLWNLKQIKIVNGATLTIRLGGSFQGDETITFKGQGDYPLFDVADGSLIIRCSDTSTLPTGLTDADTSYFGAQGADWTDNSNYVPLILDGESIVVKNDNTYHPLIDVRSTSGTNQNIFIEDVTFRNAPYRAIHCRGNEVANFSVKDCVFESTVKVDKTAGERGGAAIRINECTVGDKVDKPSGNRVDITNFYLENCKFDGQISNDDGGAIESYGRIKNTKISDCLFQNIVAQQYSRDGNTKYKARGGAILLGGYMGKVLFDTVKFDNCSTDEYGGAILFTQHKNSNNNMSMFYDVTFQNCSFNNCKSKEQNGGAISFAAQVNNLKFLGCDFSGCTAYVNGGALSIGSASFTGYNDWQSDEGMPGYDTKNDTLYNWTTSTKVTTIKNLEVGSYNGKRTTFTGCVAQGYVGNFLKDENDNFLKDENGNYIPNPNDPYVGGNGGAIWLADTSYIDKVNIYDTTFGGDDVTDGCIATDGGSAIFFNNGYYKTVTLQNLIVKNCDFNKNEDGTYAGGKYEAGTIRTVGSTTAALSMSGCTFTNNKSAGHGGGLYWNANNRGRGTCTAEVTGCTFDNNTAKNYGGAIYCEASMTISGCNILNNTAGECGGGIAQQVYNNKIYMLQNGDATDLTLDNTTWIHHNTAPLGGGISIRANATQAIEDNSTITHAVRFQLNGASVYDNTATRHGGGVYFIAETYAAGSADQAEVERFEKTITIDGDMTAKTGNIFRNTATQHGGGIYMESNKNTTLKITNGHVSGNSAGGNGGGIYLTGIEALCSVTGGIVGGEGNDSTGKPLSNTAVCGGGIAISGGAQIQMTGGEISYNNVGTTETANRQGGGIWLAPKEDGGVANSMTMSDGTVKYNSTPGGSGSNGGGIYIGKGNSFTFSNGTIDNNSCGFAWGGGIYVDGGCTVTLQGGTISNNKAGAGGGLLTWGSSTTKSTLTMHSGCTIQGNTAGVLAGGTGNGGGMYLGYCTVNFYGGTISGNTATEKGGGFNASASTVTIYDATISDNKAKNGGGIGVEGSSSVTVTVQTAAADDGDTTAKITGNTATSAGGGVYVDSGSATINAGSIINNKAYNEANSTWGNGGGVYVENATVNVGAVGTAHGIISHNEASNGGGVYAWDGADVTVENGYLTYNNAYGKTSNTTAYHARTSLAGTGGGVFLARGTADNSSTFTLKGTTYAIYGNLADFAADDVFASGEYTQLTVPKVKDMNLTGYEFSPEGWFEDYPKNDSAYENGLALAAENTGITNGIVFRYRGSDPFQRVLIRDDSNITADTNASTKQVNDTDVYVCMTLGMPAAINDTVVIDYGQPVNIHVLTNEAMSVSTPTLIGIGPKFNHVEGIYGYTDNPSGYGDNHNTAFGLAEITDKANGVVKFSINTMSMDKEAAFSYVVQYTNSEDAQGNPRYFYYYADVIVIPATTIYYEDNFGGITYTVVENFTVGDNGQTIGGDKTTGWNTPADGVTGSMIQNEDRPGVALENAIDQDNVYGYDSNYASGLKYSLGNAAMINVNAKRYATATFTFKGTGFDVISLTDSTTGLIVVKVEELNDQGAVVKTTNYVVDTYYGYKYEGGEWVVDTNSSDALYQVPVIKVDTGKYAKYNVTITATYADFFDHNTTDDEYNFYLDAIRIYDPANDGQDNSVIEGAYVDDGEGWPSYQELRDLIISDNTSENLSAEGVVFIDGKDSNYSVSDYTNYGPNNELYLAPGQSIAFELENPTNVAKVQIAFKSANGKDVDFSILTSGTENGISGNVNTSSDMYYDITVLKDTTVVIKNTETEDTDLTNDAILSITNIKTTFTQKPATRIKMVRVTGSTGTTAKAMLEAYDEAQKPGQDVPGGEENPTTGDVALDAVVTMAMTACVLMLAVLIIPNARKKTTR